jgi:hypothetical protein
LALALLIPGQLLHVDFFILF